MATKHHTHVRLSALAAMLLALAIGSVPVVTLVALSQRVAVLP